MRARFFLILIFFGFLITSPIRNFISNGASPVNAEELSKELSANEDKPQTKIMISTSGPAEFKSYALENPYRIVVAFQSQNVISDMDREIAVADGLIKKITSSYFEKGNRKAVKMLTFELSKQASYKISQEDDAIVLSIQAPLEIPAFNITSSGIFEVTENSNNTRRLEVMDTVLKQAKEIHSPSIAPIAEILQPAIIDKESIEKNRQGPIQQGIFLFSGLILGLGFLAWAWYKYNINKSKGLLIEEIKELQATVQKKDTVLGQEETLRKAAEKALLEKDKECQLLQGSCGSFKDALVKKGLAKELISAEGERGFWISGKSPEQRISSRLLLDKDFHNTVIVKIGSSGVPRQIKSFAENISSGGLCFQTKSELDEKNLLDLRLFFYGGNVHNIKTRAKIVWKKTIDSKNCYGVTFEDLGEKVKLELERYIQPQLNPRFVRQDRRTMIDGGPYV